MPITASLYESIWATVPLINFKCDIHIMMKSLRSHKGKKQRWCVDKAEETMQTKCRHKDKIRQSSHRHRVGQCARVCILHVNKEAPIKTLHNLGPSSMNALNLSSRAKY